MPTGIANTLPETMLYSQICPQLELNKSISFSFDRSKLNKTIFVLFGFDFCFAVHYLENSFLSIFSAISCDHSIVGKKVIRSKQAMVRDTLCFNLKSIFILFLTFH